MQKRKSVHRRQCRRSRRLATETLESRQLMAADFGMLGSTGVPAAMLARIQDSGVDVSAMVSKFRSGGITSQQQMAIRQQLAGNPAAKALIQQRMQAAIVQAELTPVSTQPVEVLVNEVESAEQVESTSETSPREAIRARVAQRVSDRFDGEVPVELQERIAARRESGSLGREGGPLSRLRALAERADIEPSDFVVRDADGNVDREATRANVRERFEDSELADNIRERVSDRFEGEVPVELQERIATRFSTPVGAPAPETLAPESVVQVVSSLGRQDVNRDGALSPLDVLLVINGLNQGDSDYSEAVDVNGDGLITPVDALLVVNALNSPPAADLAIAAPLREAAADQFFGGDLDEDDEDDEEGIFSLGLNPRVRG
jgi:hypothetical protein